MIKPLSTSMRISLSLIVVDILITLFLVVFSPVEPRAIVEILFGGLVTSLSAGLICAIGPRYSLLQTLFFFLIASVQVGLWIALAVSIFENSKWLIIASMLLSPCAICIVGGDALRKKVLERNIAASQETSINCSGKGNLNVIAAPTPKLKLPSHPSSDQGNSESK